MLKKFKHLFDIRRRNKQYLFIVLTSFTISLILAHLYSLNSTKYVYIRGYHIHHFYFGTACLALGGILGVLSNKAKKKRIASALIGIGLGLFSDEIGMLLNCTSDGRVCSYYFPDWDDITLTIMAIIVFLIAVADTEVLVYFKKIRNFFVKD